jgi:hypothetical protein
MNRYQALTTTHGTVDIGTFVDLNTAKTFALQQYGADLQDVLEIPVITVNTSAFDPGWLLVALGGFLILALAENKKRKRKRGRHVSATR